MLWAIGLFCPEIKGIKVDGEIEGAWSGADSALLSVQRSPDYGKPSPETVKVYLGHDAEALYFAFLWPMKHEPDVRLTGRDGITGDQVQVFIDTYGDKAGAYYFALSAAGLQEDARIRGGDWDMSWDGVLDGAVLLRGDTLVAEFKIPFRSIRYGPGPWGVFFKVVSPPGNLILENPLMPRQAWLRVEEFARLEIDPPRVRSLHLELYPVALGGYSKPSEEYSWLNEGLDFRYEREGSYAEAGLDLTWAPSQSVYLQATLNPDFAQVEADPFILNTSKYEVYLPERRPFFVEGADIFSFPFALLYTRRIGQSFFFGAKALGQSRLFDWGGLYAHSEPYAEVYYGDTLRYPSQEFGALRGVFKLGGSELGLMGVGETDSISTQGAFGSDFYLRLGDLRGEAALAASVNGDTLGWLGRGELRFESERFFAEVNGGASSEEFDISKVGFYPWAGNRNAEVKAGPAWYPDQGPLREAHLALFGSWTLEAGEDSASYGTGLGLGLEDRRGNGGDFWAAYIRDYELGQRFANKMAGFHLHTDWRKPVSLGLRMSTSYGYNYLRGYFARTWEGGGHLKYTFRSGLVGFAQLSAWVEEDTLGKVAAVTLSPRPSLSWIPSRGTKLSVYVEPSYTNEGSGWELLRVVHGTVFTWNFAPKSWLYIVYNLQREGDVITQSAFQVKVRKLLFI